MLEPRRPDRQVALSPRQVEPPGFRDQLDGDLWMALREARQCRSKHETADPLGCGELHRPLHPSGAGGGAVGRHHHLLDAFCLNDQCLTRIGESVTLRCLLEERYSELLFQRRDVSSNGGLAHPERRRRGGQRLLPGQGEKEAEVVPAVNHRSIHSRMASIHNCFVPAQWPPRILVDMLPCPLSSVANPTRAAFLGLSLMAGRVAAAEGPSDHRGPGVTAARDAPPEVPALWPEKVYYRSVSVLGHRIFYRESGRAGRPVILMLHGFPASSHSYRELIPLLSGRYHVLAPDYLGSGFSDRPSPDEITYRFDLLAEHVTGFVEALGITRYVLYMQDFGSPVGFRVALAHPERLRGLVVQNANAYLEGLSEIRRPLFRRFHDDRSPEGLAALEAFVSADGIRNRQYLRDVPGERAERMSPDTWTQDLALLATAQDRRIQIQLLQDYQSNLDAYPTWQAFLRKQQPPTLIVWGKSDQAFLPAGAEAYLRDLPKAELHLLDAGHFAVEEQPVPIAQYMTRFMDRLPPDPVQRGLKNPGLPTHEGTSPHQGPK